MRPSGEELDKPQKNWREGEGLKLLSGQGDDEGSEKERKWMGGE